MFVSYSAVHPFISGVISILCSRLVNCRNLSSHCLGVNIWFPSNAFASRFGTVFFSAMVPVKNFRFVFLKSCLLRHVVSLTVTRKRTQFSKSISLLYSSVRYVSSNINKCFSIYLLFVNIKQVCLQPEFGKGQFISFLMIDG